jgi:hypothetical protein
MDVRSGAIIHAMPKARKPMPAMYAPKGSGDNETIQKTTSRPDQKTESKNTSGAHGQDARAPKQTQHHPESSTANLEVPAATSPTSETTNEPVKTDQPVAFCANGFLLANTQRLGEAFKLEIGLESGLGFVGTPAFPFSKRLERGNTWPNGRSRVGLFPRTDAFGRLLPVQQVNSARPVLLDPTAAPDGPGSLESDTISSSFHLVGLPVDTRGLLTVRIYPQRLGLHAFNVIARASSELLEVATITGEARLGVEVQGEILKQNDGLELVARSVVGLRLVIPRHHLPGFKPGKAVQTARHGKKQSLPE